MGILSEGIGISQDETPVVDAATKKGVIVHRGQVRFAYRLAEQHGSRLMHVHGLGWYHWDGTRWSPDHRGHATNAVLAVLRNEWGHAFDDKDLAREVRSCESASGVRGILDIAKALNPFACTVADLDTDPYLLNVANGTVDLRTMQLMNHNPSDRLTKVTRAAYSPESQSDEWEQFLAQVLPDANVRAYLARYVGVSLLGEVREQTFTIAKGAGANGKGVFYGAVLHALGDYGHTAESDLFMTTKSNANAASPAIMALLGRRFVVCSETERDHKLAAALMKNLTGGDPITARSLHRDPVTFDPSHTVMLVTNFLPKVAGDDPAVWRRMRVIPFDVEIPENQRDAELGSRLQLSADAILTWAMKGYRQYVSKGMETPEAVQAATTEYRRRSDAVARFIEDRCFVGEASSVTVAALHDAWSEWAKDDGADAMSKNELMDEMDKRGFPSARTKTQRIRRGIGILDDDERNA